MQQACFGAGVTAYSYWRALGARGVTAAELSASNLSVLGGGQKLGGKSCRKADKGWLEYGNPQARACISAGCREDSSELLKLCKYGFCMAGPSVRAPPYLQAGVEAKSGVNKDSCFSRQKS